MTARDPVEDAVRQLGGLVRGRACIDADDLRQEAAIAVWRHDVRNPDAPAEGMLAYTIARQACIDAIRNSRGIGRRNRRNRPGPARMTVAVRDALAAQPDVDPGLATDVREAVATLTPAQRAGVRSAYWMGMTAPEAARAAGITPAAATYRVIAGRRAVARALSAYGPEGGEQ